MRRGQRPISKLDMLGGLNAAQITLKASGSRIRCLCPSQSKDEFFPLCFERIHVSFSQDALQSGVTGGIFLGSSNELVVKLHQQVLLLQVVAQIPSLRIVFAITFGSAVEFRRS